MSETFQNLCRLFHKFTQASVNYLHPIVFTDVIDAAAIVNYWEIIEIHGKILEGINPNNFLDIKGEYYGELLKRMK